uniref:Phosphorylase b kinase regulatory subunit n=1 Tax=Macrostomum lignano TaxID=282301 RepID=A0A1I8F2B1_9PLAT
ILCPNRSSRVFVRRSRPTPCLDQAKAASRSSRRGPQPPGPRARTRQRRHAVRLRRRVSRDVTHARCWVRAPDFAALARRKKSVALTQRRLPGPRQVRAVADSVAAAAEAAVRRAQDAKSSSKPVSCSRRSSDSSAKYVLKDSIEKADNADLMKIFKRKHIERQDSPACRLSELAEKELLRRLEQSEHLYEQFEIIYQLYIDKGLIYDTGWKEKSGSVTLRDLVAELYERAGATKQWWLVRYTAGMLEKAVENLPVCITDLLVRQKQSSQQLRELIKQASFNDLTLGVLTQEVLVYLSMLARTEPQLFANMYRIRVGLIIRVMGTEIGRSLRLNAEDATEHLLSLSPFEMKTLLHHILSGKEFHAEYVPLSQGGASHITIVSAKRDRAQPQLLRPAGPPRLQRLQVCGAQAD